MIITRDIINKNIKFHDITINSDGNYSEINYGFDELNVAINLYKNLLIDSGVKVQQTITITEENSIWQLAALFASFELGLKVAITDYLKTAISDKSNHQIFEVDSKTKSLLPINYTLNSAFGSNKNEKIDYLNRIACEQIVREFSYEDIPYNISIENTFTVAQEHHIATRSSTSGSTGIPKCVEHSHQFLYTLTKRNSNLFSGNYVTYKNLNHGSSIFCYCIPALASEKTTNFYNICFRSSTTIDFNSLVDILKSMSNQETHMNNSYAKDTELILRSIKNFKLPNLTLHVLCNIKKEWVKNYFDNKFIGDIISNFGSNETTGPIFINKASNKNFSEIEYQLYDNFFGVKLLNSGTEVTMPIYNKVIMINDRFRTEDNKSFTHLGRTDLIRINDIEVDMQRYQSIVEDYFDCNLVYDKIKSEIYLSIWNEIDSDLLYKSIYKINEKLKELSLDMHFISKYDFLNYETYLSGIKLDMEKLREYFRNPNGNYKKLN